VQNPAKALGGEVLKRCGSPMVKAHEQRDAFSNEELRQIFSATWFQVGVGRRTRKGLFHSYRPHYYWLPLLALFAGGRLNELAQLYLSDIRIDSAGIAFIDFNLEGEGKLDLDSSESGTGADKSLKTINSQRSIPIHDFLLQRGFLDYVEALRTAGHTRLFPELKFDKNKGYGKAAGSWFNERYLGNTLNMPRDGRRSFHSLRHNYATTLGAAGLATTLKSDLMGHSRSKALVESRYSKGASMAEFKKAIDALAYPLPRIEKFDLFGGMEAVEHALKLKTAHRKPSASI
jgi:integrase